MPGVKQKQDLKYFHLRFRASKGRLGPFMQAVILCDAMVTDTYVYATEEDLKRTPLHYFDVEVAVGIPPQNVKKFQEISEIHEMTEPPKIKLNHYGSDGERRLNNIS